MAGFLRQLSKDTIATCIRDLKTFSRWLCETGWTERIAWST
jgi:hypothetical protein